MQDYFNKDVDGGVWLSAVEEYAVDTPEFYPSAFGRILDHYLRSTNGIDINIGGHCRHVQTNQEWYWVYHDEFININNSY